jgi:Rrf2 family nitric oxide-sensitive transcriptional repressor
LISALAAAGLLETRRGGGGGAMLARAPGDIRLGDVVAILGSLNIIAAELDR